MSDDKKKKDLPVPDLVKKKTTLEDFNTTFLRTGNVAFDIAISDGKGLPVGDFIMVSAPRGTGKSTLCYDLISRMLKKHKDSGIPFRAMHIDIEGSSTLAASFGLADFIESGDLIHYTGQVTYKQLEQLYNAIIAKQEAVKDLKLIIIDSIAGVTTEEMVEKNVEKAHFGLTAKAQSEFMKKFTPLCNVHGITTIMINHEKIEQGVMSYTGPVKKEAGGDAAMYMSSVLLRLSKRQGGNDSDLKKKSQKTIHGTTEISDKFLVVIKSPDKNRYCRIGEVEMLVQAGKRIINAYIVREILENNGLIKRSGNSYTISTEIIAEEDADKKFSKKELHSFISKNMLFITEYLIAHNMYCYKIPTPENDEDPDGWENNE